MRECKGNVGHLMQHWTLCEMLDAAQKNHVPGVSFIDAHAMAPRSHIPFLPDAKFAKARAGLPGQQSVYEQAWHQLAQSEGYPNSAAFVNQLWTHDLAMLLCEIDPLTILELRPWLDRVQNLRRCRKPPELFDGDWRDRFEQQLPGPFDVGLTDDAVTLISFDPNMYNKRRKVKLLSTRLGLLYPEDIERASVAINELEGGILIQLSTYNTNDGNSQEAAIESIDPILEARGLTRCAKVRPHGGMMSLVYARNVSWSDELANLPERFTEWLKRV